MTYKFETRANNIVVEVGTCANRDSSQAHELAHAVTGFCITLQLDSGEPGGGWLYSGTDDGGMTIDVKIMPADADSDSDQVSTSRPDAARVAHFVALRQAHNLTQRQAAELIGVTPGAVEHWEQGRRTVPQYAINALSPHYVAYDDVTGWMSPPKTSRESAGEAADKHNAGCGDQGGFGRATVYIVGPDGYLVGPDGRNVYPPSGQSSGAVRFI